METMRIKRQPRAKRQKTGTTRDPSETCEQSPISQSQSPDMAGESFIGSSDDVSPTSATPINSLSPPYAGHSHRESVQPLPHGLWDASALPQHRANIPQWSPTDFNHPGNMQHQTPYGVPPTMSQQTFPFTLPGCSPSTGQVPTPIPFKSLPGDIEQYYTNQTQSPTHLSFNAISLSHGLGSAPDVKMSTQPTPAYSAWIEEPRWDATPGSYNQQYQHTNNHHPHNYQ